MSGLHYKNQTNKKTERTMVKTTKTWTSEICVRPVNTFYVVVNFLSQVIFIFPLFLGMVIYANEFETMEKQNYLK